MPLPPFQKTQVVELCESVLLRTDGSTSFDYVDFDTHAIEWRGPEIEAFRVLTSTYNPTSQFLWAVFVTWQNLNRTWSTPVQISADLTAAGDTVGSLYATPTNYAGRRMRFLIGAKNSTSAGTVHIGLVRAWLTVRFRG